MKLAKYSSLILVLLAALSCDGGPTPPTPPPQPPAPPPPSRAAVELRDAQGTAQRQTAGDGYDYVVMVTVNETGGVAATFNAWDISFRAGSSSCGTVRFASSALTPAGASMPANSSKTLQFGVTADASFPLCTSFTISASVADANANTSTPSSSGDIRLLAPPPTPTRTGRYKCSGTGCVFDPNDSGPNQCTPGSAVCAVPPPAPPPPAPPVPPPANPASCSIICTACSSSYGAIAYSRSTRRCGYGTGYDNRPDAEVRASQECGGGDCFTAVWFRNSCGAVASSSSGSWGWGFGSSQTAAQSNALAGCTGGSTPGPPPSAPPTTLPQPSCRTNGSSAITVSFQNRSPYTVRLTFTGPTTRAVTIAARGTGSLTLTAGRYVVTGEVSASNVQFNSSTWNVSSGCDYEVELVVQ